MNRIYYHFFEIAERYKNIRTTDIEPVLFVQKQLKNFEKIVAAEIGCGVGRYGLQLVNLFQKKLTLYFVDFSPQMLKELIRNIPVHSLSKVHVLRASAEHLPFHSKMLTALFAFNAVHHFHLSDFVREAERTVQENGFIFIYTRLRSQNRRNIWGEFFPEFYERETRLYELDDFIREFKTHHLLNLAAIKYFKYDRTASINWLVNRAVNHHYSTFSLYEPDEFEEALRKFKKNLLRHFDNPNKISWVDENVLFVLKKIVYN
ncbi:hypothetical protein BMS3Bbin03_00069 [bacterium BMS3Bbin03]|nr:hypothetical protein BMS3Bbin03_00069 [bacterium BMS3Bbin03]HDL78713.1 class I SAM-dependent methyltransferase [Bacteroidota bacterium]